MNVSEARAGLSQLVSELAEHRDAGASLAENAIEIGPYRKGGAWLVPEADAKATIEHVAALEDELENIAIGLMLTERLDEPAGTTPGYEVLREMGFAALAEGLPRDVPR
jgi:hypothetical protein